MPIMRNKHLKNRFKSFYRFGNNAIIAPNKACKVCSKTCKIKNHDQYINHIQDCSINELENKSALVNDIFSISEAHIPRTIEDAALHALKTKMKSNQKSSTIEFKTGGRVSLSLLIHYITLSNSYLICYKLIFLVLFFFKNI